MGRLFNLCIRLNNHAGTPTFTLVHGRSPTYIHTHTEQNIISRSRIVVKKKWKSCETWGKMRIEEVFPLCYGLQSLEDKQNVVQVFATYYLSLAVTFIRFCADGDHRSWFSLLSLVTSAALHFPDHILSTWSSSPPPLWLSCSPTCAL